MYRSLEPKEIIATVEALSRRIDSRFAEAGLAGVAHDLLAVARESERRAEWIARPQYLLRFLEGVVAMILLAAFLFTTLHLGPPPGGMNLDVLQDLESGLGILVYLGATIIFLVTLERRIKRNRTLRSLHELRSLAHVIDMHQLAKDPDRVAEHQCGAHPSPRPKMSPLDLMRYLDYCSEMLSLIGKLAALYVQGFDDAAALASVNEVEALTGGLSRKIWQKIQILNLPGEGRGMASGA